MVVPTRNRARLLHRAVQTIVEQDHSGPLEVVVVFDGVPVDDEVVALATPGRAVRVVANRHAPGLAGARNTGIEAATSPVVAFCDDDDEWRPHRLRRQLPLLTEDSPVVSCGVEIVYGEERFVRLPAEEVHHVDFLRHRVPAVHSSTLLMSRDFLERVGTVDEAIPGSYGEDWDLLLRATEWAPVRCVREPLVRVHWHPTSYFIDDWATAARGLDYLIDKHPGFARDRRARGRITGQRAFYHVAAGHRGDGARLAVGGLLDVPTGRHAWAALLVSAGVLDAGRVLSAAHSLGRGV